MHMQRLLDVRISCSSVHYILSKVEYSVALRKERFGSGAISRHKDRNLLARSDRKSRHLYTILSMTLFCPQGCIHKPEH